MTFKTPSPALYFGSLLIAAPLAGLAYWLLQNQNFNNTSLIMLGTGLFIGHLIGVCSHATATQKKTPAAARLTSSDETLSLYVGNLAYRAQRSELQKLFAQYGEVSSVRIMTDRATRRPRGYAFVEMDANGAREAIKQLDNTEFCGRDLRVSEAKQKQD